LPNTVVCSISHADGSALREALETGCHPLITMEAEVDTGWRKTPILVAELPGPAEEDNPFVLFSGHHDTWYHGVMDNGSANAGMMEVARLCAGSRVQPRGDAHGETGSNSVPATAGARAPGATTSL
jgi:hypothetical protein